MLRQLLALTAAMTLSAMAANSAACDLKMQPSAIFGGSCNVLVGYAFGSRVGPFHIGLPDGSVVTAGDCEGYVHVSKVQGSTVSLEAFHTVPPRVYSVANDCRSSTRLQ